MVIRGVSSFLVLFCIACAARPGSADVWEKEWSIPPNAQVRVNTNYGNIRVDAGDYVQAKAFVRTVGWRISGNEVSVTANQVDNRVEIEVRLHSSRKYWQIGNEIKIELTVPRSASVDLHTDHGNLTTHGIEGALRADTGDGNISAVGGKGTILLHTGDGNIIANEMDGSLSGETGDGNINIEGRFEGLNARTGDGNLNVTTHAGSRLSAPWNLRTGDGNIVLNMQDNVGANLDATTGDGRVAVDFTVDTSGKIDTKTVRGPMNGGGEQLVIHTGDGNIRIDKR